MIIVCMFLGKEERTEWGK